MARAKRTSPPALVRAFETGVNACRGTEQRKMFGYPAAFANGNMFAGLVRDFMVLRLKDADRTALLLLLGAKPLDSESELKTWLRKAYAFGRSLPPKRRAR